MRASISNTILLLAFSTFSFGARSQTDVEPYQEYGKRVKAAQQVSALSSELFGESVSLYNGKTEFQVTDVDLPGNNGLPVRAGRRYVVESRKQMGYLGGFGVWDVEVPYIHGIFQMSVGWVTSPAGRCSSGMPPNTSSAWFQNDEIWSGTNMYIPEQGDRELLRNTIPNTVQVSDGNIYPWTTSGDFRIRCLASTANGYAGEGFLALGPDGTKYFFNHGVEAAAPRLGTQISGNNVPRKRIFLLATRVEDRFGNYVTYAYTGSKLTSIAASDGRQLTFAYGLGNGLITSVTTDGGRVWTYQYTNSQLVSVTLPDTSRWTYATPGSEGYGFIPYYEPPMPNESGEALCLEPGLPSGAFQLQIGHPSGATGQFDFAILRHYRDGTPALCGQRAPGDDYLFVTNYFDNYSLTSKTITGPGLTGQAWTYNYEGYSDDFVAAPGSCVGCDDWKLVTINEPGSQKKTYKFGITYGVNEGRLLTENVVDSGGVTRQTVQNTYMTNAAAATQPFPDKHGESWTANFDSTSNKIRPVVLRQIIQDGANFNRSVTTYDAFARPVTVDRWSGGITFAAGRTDVTEYHDNLSKWVVGQVSKITNANTNVVVSQVDYDPSSALRVREYGPGTTMLQGILRSTMAYYGDGTLATVKDGNNNITTLSNWYRGIPRTVQYPATPETPSGATQTAAVNNNGWITAITDENGFSTGYGYDAMGRLASITYPTGDSTVWNNTSISFQSSSTPVYGLPAGHWRQTIATGNARTVTIFDAFWRPVVVENYDLSNTSDTISQVVSRYDARGQLSFQSYPQRNLDPAVINTWANPAITPNALGLRNYYDALKRVTRVEQDSELGPLVTTSVYLPNLYTQVTNPRGQQTLTAYRAFDSPEQKQAVGISELGGDRHTEIYLDIFGKTTQLRRRNGTGSESVSRYFVYDTYQRLCRTDEPETGTTLVGYDGADNVKWSATGLALGTACEADGTSVPVVARKATRYYDSRNRLTALNFPDGNGDQNWTYWPDGLPNQVTTFNYGGAASFVNSYQYNKRRLLTGEGRGEPGLYWGLGYEYDGNGNLSLQSYPTGLVVGFTPNALGQPTNVHDNLSNYYASAISYFPNGALKQFTFGNGLTHSMAQNARQLPARVTDGGNALDHDYGYDPNGNVDHIYDYIVGAPTPQHRYMTYDGLDRLTGTGSAMFGGSDHWHRFTYDALDNLKSWKHAGIKDYAEYVYDAKNQLASIKDSGGASIVGLGYDVQGNLANKNGQQYIFDYGNRLRATIGKESYAYDAYGRRVNSGGPSTLTRSMYSQAGQLVYQENGSLQKATENIYLNGSLLAIRDRPYSASTPSIKYQHTDALGSPVAVTDAVGTVIDRTNYEPYGAAINKTVEGIGYAGQVMDSATSLTYMQQRYYDAAVGRFLSVDPVSVDSSTGANFNRYSYAANNPYRFLDPDGRQEKEKEERTDFRSIASHPGAGGMSVSGLPESDGTNDGTRVVATSTAPVHQASEPLYCDSGADCDFMYNQREALDGNISMDEFMDRTVAQGKGGMVGAVLGLGIVGVAEGGPAAWALTAGGLKHAWKNIKFDGPSPGLQYANGRVIGVSWRGSNLNVRLDYAPIPGSKGTPVLHINFGKSGRGQAPHIVIWDPRWYNPNMLK